MHSSLTGAVTAVIFALLFNVHVVIRDVRLFFGKKLSTAIFCFYFLIYGKKLKDISRVTTTRQMNQCRQMKAMLIGDDDS